MIKRDDILHRIRERPFRPFKIHDSSGRVHEVRHPENAIVTTRSVLVLTPRPNSLGPEDVLDYALVSILHITCLDPVAGETPPMQSGSGSEVVSA
jgi:hypothetical protein